MNRYKDLLFELVKQKVYASHKGSYLGIIWLGFDPFFRMCVYGFLFGVVFSSRYNLINQENGLEFALGLFLSFAIFQVIADTLNESTGQIIANANFVKKVIFPLEILTVASIGAGLVKFAISYLLCLIAMLFLGIEITVNAIYVPFLVLPVFLLAMGIGWFFSSVGVYFRDLSQITQSLSLILLFGSAVFYSSNMLPEAGWKIMRFNPLVHIIEQSRNLLLWQKAPDFVYLGYSLLVSVIVLIFGYFIFRKLKNGFADVL